MSENPQDTSDNGTTELQWELSGFGDEIGPDPELQVAVLQALGARHIEVRAAWGTNVVEMSAEQLTALRKVLVDRGMGVSAIASPIGKVDVAAPIEAELTRLDAAIDAAQTLGTPFIRVFSFYRAASVTVEAIRDRVIDQLGALTERAAAAGVVLLHENEKGIYGDVPARVHELITAVDSTALRVAWDSANYVQCGVKPYTDGFALLAPYIDYLQVKDAVAATGVVVPAGDGDGELAETVAALRDRGYAGFASLEPHLADPSVDGPYGGPAAFGRAARGFAAVAAAQGVRLG